MRIFLISMTVSLIVVIILSLAFRGKEKTDKGFQFVYYGLSYRRKMIRTLYVLPVNIIIIVGLYYTGGFPPIMKHGLSSFLMITFGVQLYYNYYMWKKHEK